MEADYFYYFNLFQLVEAVNKYAIKVKEGYLPINSQQRSGFRTTSTKLFHSL